MARSRTTFGPGHKAGFKPGNALALRHGAYSKSSIEARVPDILVRVEAELVELPFITRPDASLVRTYCYVTAQKEALEDFFAHSGGMFTTRGVPKKGAEFHLKLVHRQQELAKVLGIGPVPRAQMAQAMAGAAVGSMEVRAAQERLRAKQALSVVS